jgi:hypothetical protein
MGTLSGSSNRPVAGAVQDVASRHLLCDPFDLADPCAILREGRDQLLSDDLYSQLARKARQVRMFQGS